MSCTKLTRAMRKNDMLRKSMKVCNKSSARSLVVETSVDLLSINFE